MQSITQFFKKIDASNIKLILNQTNDLKNIFTYRT